MQRELARFVAGKSVMAPNVVFGGAWFDEQACRDQFVQARSLTGFDRDALGRCIAKLGLTFDDARNRFSDLGLVHYPPGIELEVRFADGLLSHLGFVARPNIADVTPTITQAALEALRIDPTPSPPGDAWFRICIDERGATTSVTLRAASKIESLPDAFATARAWKHRPFVLDDHPLAVCSLVHAGDARETVPMVLPEEANAIGVSTEAFAKRMTIGDPHLAPDDADKAKISGTIRGEFLICTRANGSVATVTMRSSTGFPDYDSKISRVVTTWQYAPILVDDDAFPACGVVVFVYTQ